jgi:hypothetical protein
VYPLTMAPSPASDRGDVRDAPDHANRDPDGEDG